jgi:hypothetical protein
MAQHLAEKVTELRIRDSGTQAELDDSGAAQGPSQAIGRTPDCRGPHRIGKGLNATRPRSGTSRPFSCADFPVSGYKQESSVANAAVAEEVVSNGRDHARP